MKKRKLALAVLLLIASACLILFPLFSHTGVVGAIESMDKQGLAAADDKMAKARDKAIEAFYAGDKEKTLKNLDKYIEKYADKLQITSSARMNLAAYRYSTVFYAVGAALLAFACALTVRALSKKETLQRAALTAALVVTLYALVAAVENVAGASSMLVTVLKKGAIYALIAVSMNLLNGFTGLFSLGQAGFMLVGAYTYAIFSIPVADRAQVYQYYAGGIIQFQLPTMVSILLAGLAAGVLAYLIGLPVLKLKSDYLAIATLGFAEIVRAVMQYDGLGPITNGSNLLRRFPTFNSVLYPFAVSGVCILLIVLLIHSTYGRAFKAIRDDEVAAEAMGINLFSHKQWAFVLSSFFAGVGGALLAMYQTTVQASAFKASMTYEILLIVVIGGMGSVTGSVMASFLFVSASEWWLRFLDNPLTIGGFEVPLLRTGFRMVVFSLVIMLVVLRYRKGIMGDRELSLGGLFRGREARKNG